MKTATTPEWHKEPAGRQPSPEEWVAWFLENDREGQIEIAEWAIRFAEESTNCFMRHGAR